MEALKQTENLIQGEGTPLRAWQSSTRLAAAPWISVAQLLDGAARLVIVAPHPDDEVLGCAGLLCALAGQEQSLLIVAVTDGEGSHPGSQHWTQAQLSQQRPLESRTALACLGLRSDAVQWHRLGLHDSAVAADQGYLLKQLRQLLRPGDRVLTTWRHDGHCDHEAVGRACAQVAGEVGASLLETPIWTWHWASPDDPRIPWERVRKLALDDATLEKKRRAIAAHASQVNPDHEQPAVLTEATLQRLLQPFEWILV